MGYSLQMTLEDHRPTLVLEPCSTTSPSLMYEYMPQQHCSSGVTRNNCKCQAFEINTHPNCQDSLNGGSYNE
jgi:hypothetical protein